MFKLLQSGKSRWILCLLALAVFAAAPLAAQDDYPWWGSYYLPGNVILSAGVGISEQTDGVAIAIQPSAGMMFYKLRPGNFFPIDFGAGARGEILLSTSDDISFGMGLGPYVSWHWGFRGFRELGIDALQYLERLDFFSTLGVNFYTFPGEANGFDWEFIFDGGFNYFLTDNLALRITTGTNYTLGLGVQLRFGPKERIGTPPDIEVAYLTPYYAWFVSYYYMSLVLSGGYFDDQTYQIGDETVHRYEFEDTNGEKETLLFSRALLHREKEGRTWWRMDIKETDKEAEDPDEWPFTFEFLTDEYHNIYKIRFMDPDRREVVVYEPDDPAYWSGYTEEPQNRFYDEQRLRDFQVGSETVQVAAGTFATQMYRVEDPGYTFTWWFSDEVPGLLVKMEGTYRTENMESIRGELQSINRNVTSPWGPAW